MWHQLWSSSPVATHDPERPIGEAGWTVTAAVRAPAATAASSAAIVAAVPPSWVTPMTSPPRCGASAASNAWAASRLPGWPAPRIPARVAASEMIVANARAPCSLVPQPVTTTGAPFSSVPRIAVASRPAGVSRPGASRRGGTPGAPELRRSTPSRRRIRPARAGSAAIISVMWQGGPSRLLGWGRKSHGSGGPGSGPRVRMGRDGGVEWRGCRPWRR